MMFLRESIASCHFLPTAAGRSTQRALRMSKSCLELIMSDLVYCQAPNDVPCSLEQPCNIQSNPNQEPANKAGYN